MLRDRNVRALGALVEDRLTFISRAQLGSLEIQFVVVTLSAKNRSIAHLRRKQRVRDELFDSVFFKRSRRNSYLGSVVVRACLLELDAGSLLFLASSNDRLGFQVCKTANKGQPLKALEKVPISQFYAFYAACFIPSGLHEYLHCWQVIGPESGMSSRDEQTGQKLAFTVEFDCENQPACDMM